MSEEVIYSTTPVGHAGSADLALDLEDSGRQVLAIIVFIPAGSGCRGD